MIHRFIDNNGFIFPKIIFHSRVLLLSLTEFNLISNIENVKSKKIFVRR